MQNNYETKKVFTPSSSAKYTFVERTAKINNQFVDALSTPGKQIVLYGHSGCGKTTLLKNKLFQIYENAFITRCMEGMTFESVMLDGFDQLSVLYSENSTSKGYKIAPEFTLSYADVKASLKMGEISNQKNQTHKNILPPQLTPQRLAKYYGESKSCWVLEDFHKIKGSDRVRLSQIMKVFMDMAEDYSDLKIIALGAVGTARKVIEYDNEMNNRVSEILIPYMQPKEIENIINTGEKLLNLVFAKDVKNKIVKYSCGLPAICHQLCLNICFNKKIFETAKSKTSINLEDLDQAISKFVEEKSDTLKAEFDKAIKIPNNIKSNIPKLIIEKCLELNKDEFSFNEVFIALKDRSITESNFTKYIDELCHSQRSEILIYDENSNLYRFNNLFLKAYSYLGLKEDLQQSDQMLIAKSKFKEISMVDKLLNIIEKDIFEDFTDTSIDQDFDDRIFEEEF